MTPARALVVTLTAVLLHGVPAVLAADRAEAGTGSTRHLQGSDLRVERITVDLATGNPQLVRFAGPRPRPVGDGTVGKAVNFLSAHARAFGLAAPVRELSAVAVLPDPLGGEQVVFAQSFDGIPVFGAQLRVHIDRAGEVTTVSGTVISDIDVSPVPALDDHQAETLALRQVAKQTGRSPESLAATPARLLIYREGLVRGLPGANHLSWEIEVTSSPDLHEVLYLDAHSGRLIDQRSEIHHLRRVVHSRIMPQPVWSEGDPLPFASGSPTADEEINGLIHAAGDTHAFFANLTDGRYLSYDGLDATMNSIYDAANIECPNAVESGGVTSFCVGMVSDDVAAHEWVHAYTGWTHGLIYQWQPGALNEATSDIFGELIDQLNGRGGDLPGDLRQTGACSTAGGRPAPTLEVTAPAALVGIYAAGGAVFNPPAPWTVSGRLELIDDGSGVPTDACQPVSSLTPGAIALIDRGTCLFRDKVERAGAAGAAGVIIVNNEGDTVFEMGGDLPRLTIPAVLVGRSDGDRFKAALAEGVMVSLGLDGDFIDSVRWLVGEDTAALGAIRDLWSPSCFGDPDRVTSVRYHCGATDNGGVHTNSGVPNHAFALLVDGGTTNGTDIQAIGHVKAARIYWRAMTVYQTPVTDFRHHADLLEESCQDLIGAVLYDPETGAPSSETVTTADCAQVAAAVTAVEMRSPPDQCHFQPLLDPDPPPVEGNAVLFFEPFDSDPGSPWSRSNRGVFPEYEPRDWVWTDDLPPGGDGGAFFAVDSVLIGDCRPGSDDQSGVMELTSPEIGIPIGTRSPTLVFDHWVATERDWDGGNLKISVNGGPFVQLPGSVFRFNGYNGRINLAGNSNPLAGEFAFTGTDDGSLNGSWGQSQVDLTPFTRAGDRIRLRFDLGVDGCNGAEGWYVDNVAVVAAGSGVRPGGARLRP